MRLLAILGAIVPGIVVSAQAAQPTLPHGAVSLVNQDTRGSKVALCADTGDPATSGAARPSGAQLCGSARHRTCGV